MIWFLKFWTIGAIRKHTIQMLRQRDFLVVTMSANCCTGLELPDELESVSDKTSRPAAASSIMAVATDDDGSADAANENSPLSVSDNLSDDENLELDFELYDSRRSKSVVFGW